jgi:hypothetical protein
MSYLHRLNAYGRTLPGAFDSIARNAMYDAYQRAVPSGNDPEEPDFVASLVMKGVHEIKAVLDAIFHNFGIRIATSGVFCHQSPMVKFSINSDTKRCELGDILFVHVHKGTSGGVQRNALLLQAKMTDPAAPMKTIPTAEQHQLALYQQWPTFTYDMGGGPLNGLSRTISPPNRHPGAQYLLIDTDRGFANASVSAGDFPMAVWMAESPLYTSQTFGRVLFDFLSQTTGRQFSDKVSATDWSRVIWDLIENGLAKGFNRRRTQHYDDPRFTGDKIPDYACLFLGLDRMNDSIVTQIVGPAVGNFSGDSGHADVPPGQINQFDNDGPGGISVVVIETDESDGAAAPLG